MSRSTVSVSLPINSASPADWNHSWDSGIQAHGYARAPLPSWKSHPAWSSYPAASPEPWDIRLFDDFLKICFSVSNSWMRISLKRECFGYIPRSSVREGAGTRTRKQKRVGNVPDLILSPFLNHMKCVNIITIYGVVNISRDTGCPGMAEPSLLPTGWSVSNGAPTRSCCLRQCELPGISCRRASRRTEVQKGMAWDKKRTDILLP